MPDKATWTCVYSFWLGFPKGKPKRLTKLKFQLQTGIFTHTQALSTKLDVSRCWCSFCVHSVCIGGVKMEIHTNF